MNVLAVMMNAMSRGTVYDVSAGFHLRTTAGLIERTQEMVMVRSRGLRISRFSFAACALLGASAALAAQGPGVDTGTAGTFTQAVMAILVYGASALIVGAGLIGALRNQ
jgi:hypothetical protein